MDTQNSTGTNTMTSPARLQTGFIFLFGVNGTLTFDQNRTMTFTPLKDKAGRYNLRFGLDDIELADFMNAEAGRADFTLNSHQKYRFIFIGPWRPDRLFVPYSGLIGSAITAVTAERWKHLLVPLLPPERVKVNAGFVKHVIFGVLAVVTVVIVGIVVAVLIGTYGHTAPGK